MNPKLLPCLTAVTTLFLVSCGGAKTGKPYPLATCVVSDEKLGSMGAPYVFVHDGQEIKLCCKNCLKDFKQEPTKYLAKLAVPPAAPPK
ncbi:MAG TPA: hypothetical protein VI454_21415 [Verrucomicrobiae bacterium]|jgi:YHS domain-containing protein